MNNTIETQVTTSFANWLFKVDESDLYDLIRDYADENAYEPIYPMWELEEIFNCWCEGLSPFEAAQRWLDEVADRVDESDSYFTFDCYGALSYSTLMAYIDKKVGFATFKEWLESSRDFSFDCSGEV